MSRYRIWVEVITDFWMERFPIRKSGSFWWFVKMLCFLLVIWFSGFLAFAFDGVAIRYLSNLSLHAQFFGTGILVLWGTRSFRSFLEWLPKWARPVLKLGDVEFEDLFKKVERSVCSFFPIFLIALAMIFLNLYISSQTFFDYLTVHSAWNFAFICFFFLLGGTGMWIIVSLWLSIFWLSRQPLNLRLSFDTSKTFRPLAIPSLYAALCFFVAISIVPFFYPPTSFSEVTIYGLFILFGALAFFIPFYNIHSVLVQLKKQELQRIDKETNELIRELEDASTKKPTSDNVTTIVARLLALQIKEKIVRKAEEWPVNISFFSALWGIALMAFVRVIVELVTRILQFP